MIGMIDGLKLESLETSDSLLAGRHKSPEQCGSVALLIFRTCVSK